MSHMSDIELRVQGKHLDCLEQAAELCGMEVRRNQVGHAWWGTFVGDSHAYGELTPEEIGKANVHALRIKGTNPKNGSSGPWEIGVYPAKDGNGFKLYFDTFGSAGRQLTQLVGENGNKLRREYAAAVALKEAHAKLAPKGFRITREALANGRVLVRCRR